MSLTTIAIVAVDSVAAYAVGLFLLLRSGKIKAGRARLPPKQADPERSR